MCSMRNAGLEASSSESMISSSLMLTALTPNNARVSHALPSPSVSFLAIKHPVDVSFGTLRYNSDNEEEEEEEEQDEEDVRTRTRPMV